MAVRNWGLARLNEKEGNRSFDRGSPGPEGKKKSPCRGERLGEMKEVGVAGSQSDTTYTVKLRGKNSRGFRERGKTPSARRKGWRTGNVTRRG